MQRALVAGCLVAIVAAAIGTFVVLRGLSFIGDALAHGVLPGVASAMILGLPSLLGAAAGAAVMVAGVSLVTRRSRLSGDTAIGLLFAGMLALGVVVISRSGSFSGDLTRILFGDVLGVSWGDIRLQGAVATVVVGLTAVCVRPFMLLSVDPDGAEAMGFSASRYHALMLALIAVTVVLSFQSVGTMLVFGMIVAPAASAALVVHRIGSMIALAGVLGCLSVWWGLAASYRYDLAAGASIVLVQVLVFFVILVATMLPRRRVAPR
ncbi:MAG: metal ABC transporter permease [Thermoleophilia bacterium]|nr:metal ABC transporter permease [Thermoleophilia bacterium]